MRDSSRLENSIAGNSPRTELRGNSKLRSPKQPMDAGKGKPGDALQVEPEDAGAGETQFLGIERPNGTMRDPMSYRTPGERQGPQGSWRFRFRACLARVTNALPQDAL